MGAIVEPPEILSPRAALRMLVRGHYDLQKLRIQIGNRIVGNFKAKLGVAPGVTEEEALDEEAKDILKQLRREYQRITDGLVGRRQPHPAALQGNPLISSKTEFALIESYIYTLRAEESTNAAILGEVKTFPIATWMLSVRGLGHLISAVLISEIEIDKARYVSSLWRYAGLDVASDGQGRSRRRDHLVKVTFTDKYGDKRERDSITFNPFLKTKLIGVLAPCFMRAASPYGEIYHQYKNRLEHHPVHKDKIKGHRHNMALRYMIKMFLKDLYVEWRQIEGLPVEPTYAEAKLGLVHGGEGA